MISHNTPVYSFETRESPL